MRTIKDLLRYEGKLIIYFSSKNVCKLFQQRAEEEGFTYGDGVKPTERDTTDLICITHNFTICCLGCSGHLAFRTAGWRSPVNVTYVDYGKYAVGEKNFIIKRVKASGKFRRGNPIRRLMQKTAE